MAVSRAGNDASALGVGRIANDVQAQRKSTGKSVDGVSLNLGYGFGLGDV
jgi:hypothetical protein